MKNQRVCVKNGKNQTLVFECTTEAASYRRRVGCNQMQISPTSQISLEFVLYSTVTWKQYSQEDIIRINKLFNCTLIGFCASIICLFFFLNYFYLYQIYLGTHSYRQKARCRIYSNLCDYSFQQLYVPEVGHLKRLNFQIGYISL